MLLFDEQVVVLEGLLKVNDMAIEHRVRGKELRNGSTPLAE